MTDKKNVIYLFTFTKLWDDVARRLQRQLNWQPVLFVGPSPRTLPTKNSLFKGIPYYEPGDARRAVLPKHVPGFTKAALDAQLLNSYAPEQSITYEMMSRFIPDQKQAGYDARRQYYWELIRIWEGMFDTLQPDMVVAASFPHRVFDYVVYLACKRRNIPYVGIDDTSMRHIKFVSTSIAGVSKPFCTEMTRLRESGVAFTLAEETKAYQERLLATYEQGRPVYLSMTGYFSERRQQEKISLFKRIMNALPQEAENVVRLLKLAVKGRLIAPIDTLIQPVELVEAGASRMAAVSPFKMELEHMRTIGRLRRVASWYNERVEDVDTATPYIYFSANFQPERSTVPDAGYFHDYHLIFDILEQATPKHWNIYYKEHPHSFHRPIQRENPRSIRFYKRLRRVCPRIRFLPPKGDPFKLIDDAQAVAMAFGTAAMEAIIRGTPVLSFGYAWYQCAPGVFQILSVDDCTAAYEKITADFEIDRNELQVFFKAAENIGDDYQYYRRDLVNSRSLQGNWQKSGKQHSTLTKCEYEAIVEKIFSELHKGIERGQQP